MSNATLIRKTFYVPFAKIDEEQRMVYGLASSEAVDSDGEIIEFEAIKAALPDYMKFGNVREMHAMSAAGVVKEAEAQEDTKQLWIWVKVVDDQAWLKVKEGVYKGFSIGGVVTKRSTQDKKRITGLALYEISLVDRPANPEALVALWKGQIAGAISEGTALQLIEALDFHRSNFPHAPAGQAARKAITMSMKPEDLQKSLGHVGWLANCMDSLIYLYESFESEQKREGDEASLICARIALVLEDLSGVLAEMVAEETAEELQRLGISQSKATAQKSAKPKKEDCYKALDEMKDKLDAMHKAVSGSEDEDLGKHMDHIRAIHKAHDDFKPGEDTKEDGMSAATLKAIKDLLEKRGIKIVAVEAKTGALLEDLQGNVMKAIEAAAADPSKAELREAVTKAMQAVKDASKAEDPMDLMMKALDSMNEELAEIKKTVKSPKSIVTAIDKEKDGAQEEVADEKVIKISRKLPEAEREKLGIKAAQKGLTIQYVD